MSKLSGISSIENVRRLLYANAMSFVVICCVIFIGPYVSANLSVVESVKVVVEVVCCYLLASHLALTAALKDFELPPFKAQRTVVSKVRQW